MEMVTQENIEKFLSTWKDFNVNYTKVNSLVEDLENCKNDYTKTILFNTAVKILNNMGLANSMGLVELLKNTQKTIENIQK